MKLSSREVINSGGNSLSRGEAVGKIDPSFRTGGWEKGQGNLSDEGGLTREESGVCKEVDLLGVLEARTRFRMWS